MSTLSAMFYVLAYLLAVIDGTLQDKGLYPSSPGRTGLRLYSREHPWIVAGLSGVLGAIVGTL